MKKKSLLKDDSFPDLNKDGEVTYADVLEGRGAFAVGGSLLARRFWLLEFAFLFFFGILFSFVVC